MLFHPNLNFFFLNHRSFPHWVEGGGVCPSGRTHLSHLKSPQSNQSSQQPKRPNSTCHIHTHGSEMRRTAQEGVNTPPPPHLFHFSFPVYIPYVYGLHSFLLVADRCWWIFCISLNKILAKIMHLYELVNQTNILKI